MSIETQLMAQIALSGARDELRYSYPSKVAMGWMWGRASAADHIESTIETQAAMNECRFLAIDYAYRHRLYK